MNKIAELPLITPLYSTYHFQGCATSTIVNNPSIRNWYLNQIMNLKCSRKFLNGFTTPEIGVLQSSWNDNPYLDKMWTSTRFMQGYVHPIIRKMIDEGYYIFFNGVDDYYIKGKSLYNKRHLNHDGCICGYNQNDKIYCIYAYDSNWIYQKFWTPQKSFDDSRRHMSKKGTYSSICAIKPKDEQVEFNPDIVLQKLHEYLDSSIKKYPKSKQGNVYGIAVHDYIAMYVNKLYDGSIPYEYMDKRVFRLIWEHKKTMLERLEKMEQVLKLDSKTSDSYKQIVSQADTMRMLYASHNIRRRDSVLPVIYDKLLDVKKRERIILKSFLKKAERVIVP